MSKGITDAGNGTGFLYVTLPNGTSIVRNIPNNGAGFRSIKDLGVEAAAVALDLTAEGSITVTGITGSGDVTAVLIDGVSQINANIAYTGATTPAVLATAIANGINIFTPTGNDYIAEANGAVLTVQAPETAGSAVNGLTITVSNTGNLTTTTINIDGGSDANSIEDEAHGYRFFIDADYGTGSATEGDLTDAVEISGNIIMRGMQTSIPESQVTIASGVITIPRNSVITTVLVETQGAVAADDLDQINTLGFAEGDILILRGQTAPNIVTFTEAGNIQLNADETFDTGDSAVNIMLQKQNLEWIEIGRGINPNANQFYITDTRANIIVARNANTLTPGAVYFITDKNIALVALQNGTLSLSGWGIFDNADYQQTDANNIGIWNSSLTPVIGQFVMWQNDHYNNDTGVNTVTSPDSDATNWTLISRPDSTYINESDAVEYDIDNDWIVYRSDKRGNSYRASELWNTAYGLGASNNPIDRFQWGSDTCFGNLIDNAVMENYNMPNECAANHITSSSNFKNNDDYLGIFSFNTMSDGAIFNNITSPSNGIFQDCSLINNASLSVITITSAVAIDNCTFESVVIASDTFSVAQDKKFINGDRSTFVATIDLGGGTNLDLVGNRYAGDITVTDAAASFTIATIDNGTLNHKIKLSPANAKTANITPTAIAGIAADQIALEALATLVLTGRSDGADYLEIQLESTFYRQTDASVLA